MADVKELKINNTTYDIKAKTVVDQNGGSLKYWTGTKAQYDALTIPHTTYEWVNLNDTSNKVYTSSLNVNVTDNVYNSDYNVIDTIKSWSTDGITTYMRTQSDDYFKRANSDTSTVTIYESHIDSNTVYNITDDTDTTLSLLELLYPVGAIYIGTMSTCPLAVLGVGTWQLKATDKVLQGAGTRGSVGSTVNESLPNITGTAYNLTRDALSPYLPTKTGALYSVSGLGEVGHWVGPTNNNSDAAFTIGLDASRSSATYQNNAPVQQDAYLVNIWERIA